MMQHEWLKFKLFVTGHSEQDALHLMFKTLSSQGHCSFEKAQRIVRPLRSQKTKKNKSQKVIKTNQVLPSNDEFLGIRVRGELASSNVRVIIVDDLEYDDKDNAAEIFNRYKNALDAVIPDTQMRSRVSMHFLVMMLEAYYFADVQAVNNTLGTNIPSDYAGDVESIRNPYSDIKQIFHNFDKRKDGAKIIPRLNVEHILSDPQTCASLRTLFAWCVEAILEFYPQLPNPLPDYCLEDGIQYAVTNGQLGAFKRDAHR